MENMRQKIDLTLQRCQPLARSSQPRKGVVSEDLGRTQFISGPSRGVRGVSKFSRKPDHNDSSESDDDLDAFSSKNKSSSFTPPSQKLKELKKGEAPRKAKTIVKYGSRLKDRSVTKATKDVDIDEENNSAPSVRRPKPRPAFKNVKSLASDGDKSPSPQLALESKRSRKTSSQDDGHGTSPLEEFSPNRTKRVKVSRVEPPKPEPAPFPMEVEHNAAGKKPSSKRSTREPAPFPVDVPPPKNPKPAPFPMQPTSSQPQPPRPKAMVSRPFPMDIPLKSSRLGDLDDDDDLKMTENDAILLHGGPRPFPMSMSQFPLETNGDISVSNRYVGIQEDHSVSKMNQFSPKPDEFGGLSLDINEEVDPSTICPYCDEPWPSAPSPTLISLLERTKRKSYADPRHGNALGLKAPLTAFIELCQRHRFEMTHLPLALASGWPTRIDFASLPKRVGFFRKELKGLLDRPDKSQFWRELRDDAKEVGMAKVVSVSGQYATFERTQPGYYGEQGSVIIHQSLYTLFPPDSIPLTSVLPLTPDQFLTRVLVPETAVLLIKQDMGLATKEEALNILDESKRYGIAMFPEQSQDDEVAEVGEQLARDRARARRKVLEERGEADADVRREVEREQRQARNSKTKAKIQRKGKGKAKGSDTDCGTNQTKVRKPKDRSKGVVADSTHQRWDENGDIQMDDVSEEPTPRPLKVDKHFRESSATSWRSRRSPSTSPDKVISRKTSASSLHEPSRTPLLSSQSSTRGGNVRSTSQWSFKLHDDFSTSGIEDATPNFDVYGKTITSKHKPVLPQTNGSDSDVLVITDNETSKLRPKARMITKNVLTSGEESGGDTFPTLDIVDKTGHQPKPRCRKQDREADMGENAKMKGALGQTKRRKKGKNADKVGSEADAPSSYGWLLSDPSD